MDWIELTEDARNQVEWGNVTTTQHIQKGQVVGIVVRLTQTHQVQSLPDALEIIGNIVIESAANKCTGPLEIKLHFDQGRVKTIHIDRPV